MNNRNRLLLGLVVMTAAIAAFWMLALSPKREEAAQLAERISAEQAELGTARAELAEYQQAHAAYPENYATVARLGKAVPADDDLRSLMVQLSDAAERSGVEFELIDAGKGAAAGAATDGQTAGVVPGVKVSEAGFSTLPMSLSFRGSYFELSAFLTRLERFVTVSNRRIDVTGRLLLLHTISLVPDTEGHPMMRAQIEAASYLVPEAEAVDGAAAPAAPAGTPAAVPETQSADSGSVPTTATITGGVR